MLRASWQSGLGAVPSGYTTFAPNALESHHRALKRLLSGKSAHRNIGQLLQEVGDVITSKAQSGFYKGLRQSVEEVPKNLFHWPKKRHQRLLPAGNDEDEETKSLQAGLSKFHNGFVYETGLETFQCVQERRGQNNVIP